MPNKEQPKQPEKKFYDIKVEALVPGILTYRVFAETEEDALKQCEKKTPNGFKPSLSLRRMIKATVYLAGSSVVKLVKNFKV